MISPKILLVIFDILGIIVGIIALFSGFNLKKTIGGRVGEGLTYFMGGVALMIAAFIYTLIDLRLETALKGHLNLFGADIHHLLMTGGMILFTISAYKFMQMVKS